MYTSKVHSQETKMSFNVSMLGDGVKTNYE